MNKTINIKFIVVVILAVAISIFVFLNLKTLELTHDIFDSVKNLVDSKSESKAKTKTKVHGNSNKNMKPHIVYEIYAVDSWSSKIFTIKYGISSSHNYKRKKGNPRPKLQIPKIRKHSMVMKYKVKYDILYENIHGRIEAKKIESELVTKYFNLKGEMPILQKLPLPDEIF